MPRRERGQKYQTSSSTSNITGLTQASYSIIHLCTLVHVSSHQSIGLSHEFTGVVSVLIYRTRWRPGTMFTAAISSLPNKRKFGGKLVEVELYAAVTKGRNSTHFFCFISTTLAIIVCKERCHLSIFPLVEGQYAVVRRRLMPSN